jgi:hypothetical protein
MILGKGVNLPSIVFCQVIDIVAKKPANTSSKNVVNDYFLQYKVLEKSGKFLLLKCHTLNYMEFKLLVLYFGSI